MPKGPGRVNRRNRPGQDFAIQARRVQVEEMYLRHMKQTEIAKILGVHQSTVSDDCRAVEEEWKERYSEDRDRMKRQVTARYFRKLIELESEYELSKQPRKKQHQEIVVSTDTKTGKQTQVGLAKVVTSHDDSLGDPRIQRLILDVHQMIVKLWGLNAPEKIAATEVDGSPIQGGVLTVIVRNTEPEETEESGV